MFRDQPFHVLLNLYIIGTMNTADRSLAMVDYALIQAADNVARGALHAQPFGQF